MNCKCSLGSVETNVLSVSTCDWHFSGVRLRASSMLCIQHVFLFLLCYSIKQVTIMPGRRLSPVLLVYEVTYRQQYKAGLDTFVIDI